MLRTYIISPLTTVMREDLETEEVWTFREKVKKELVGMIEVIDPIRLEYETTGLTVHEAFNYIGQLKKARRFKEAANFVNNIIDIDLGAVKKSNFVIAYIHSKLHTVGGIHEMVEASYYKIPIYLTSDNLEELNAWIMSLTYKSGGEMFESVDDLVYYIKDMCSENQDLNLITKINGGVV